MAAVGPFPRVHNALRAANVPERDAVDAADAIATALRRDDPDSSSLHEVAGLKADLRALRIEVRVVGAMVLPLLVRLSFPGLFR